MSQYIDRHCSAFIYRDFKNRDHGLEGIRARFLERPAIVAKRLKDQNKQNNAKVTQLRKRK